MGNYHVPFWRAVEGVTPSLTLIIERWFEGIYIPIRSDQTVSSTDIACGADKPLKSHLETALKQEVSIKTSLCLD